MLLKNQQFNKTLQNELLYKVNLYNSLFFSYNEIGDVMFQKQKNQNDILCYAYEIVNSEDVNIYKIRRSDEQIVRTLIDHYYLFVLGQKTIEKLQWRGYLSMEEVYQKYQVTEIPIVEEKKEGYMKTFFQKRKKH